jgi:hypothetical protein
MPVLPFRHGRAAVAIAAAAILTTGPVPALADGLPPGSVAIVDTKGPGGPLGLNGFDVSRGQRVAERFTVPADLGDVNFLRGSVWLMNNAVDQRARLLVSLQTDRLDEGGSASQPSGVEVARWHMHVKTDGWVPVEQFFGTLEPPLLKAGRNYWIVLASRANGGEDPVWTFARHGTLWTTTTGADGRWQAAGPGGAITLRVDVLPVNAAQ